MTTNCLLHNEQTCAKQATIKKSRSNHLVKVVYAYDWNSQTDNPALVHDEVMSIISELKNEFPTVRFRFDTLRGKDGSIYCDICRQIRSADVGLFDISTHNLNVIFELGLATGAGICVFMLHSMHSRQRQASIPDLNGILEYRFSRRSGDLFFQAGFRRSFKIKLRDAARRRLDT